jgi:teichuronic acid biosynthesis protein TuaF
MKDMMKRIMNRAKKFAIFLLLIPILTAGAAYVLASQSPATYTAKAEIMLGNFENTFRTNPNVMKKYVKSTEFINKINEDYGLGLDVGQVKSRFSVTALVAEGALELSYRGTDLQNSEENLNKLVDGILKESTERIEQKRKELETRMKTIEAIETEEDAVKRESELHDMQVDYDNLQNSFVSEEVTGGTSNVVSPIQRAILGFLIGFIISVFILLLPELFREEKN